eukprot:COSAG06_NODE_1851_length_8215_cov_39.893790_9_plen_210_part_00
MAASLYGKDEDNSFGFAQDDIDGFIAHHTELMLCTHLGEMFAVGPNIGRAMLTFCISDLAKEMLLSNDGFIPLLVRTVSLEHVCACAWYAICLERVCRTLIFSRGLIINAAALGLEQVNGLLLDPDHKRNNKDTSWKSTVQLDFAEAIQQISLYPPGMSMQRHRQRLVQVCIGCFTCLCVVLILKMIILPRQARDKHRENSKREKKRFL